MSRRHTPTPFRANPFRAGLLGAALAALLPLAAQPAAAQSLSMGISAPPASIDPHYYTLTPSIMLSHHFFDTLVKRDENARLIPGLAESWRPVDETTWEFRLREGVAFHNGAPLTAEDVAYSLRRVPTVQSPSSFAVYTRAITGVEVVDARTIRLKTAAPYPLLPSDVAAIFILPRGLGENVASASFNSAQTTIGTGPFRFVSYAPNDRVVMERNDGYWGNKPEWQRVDYRIITNSGSRVAALLSGDVAMIDNVPTQDLNRIRSDNRVTIAEGTSLRLIFLGLDVFRDAGTPDITGPNGERLDKNPLQDRRVREALSIAINREAIASRIMEGASVPAGQFMPEGAFGYDPSIPVPRFEAERARRLLAEAGYPNGFTVTLRGPNDRYVNDAQIIQVVAQMWTRIGVKTSVDAQPLATLIGRLNRNEASAYLLGWSNSTGEPSTSLRAILGTRTPESGLGLSNYGRYSNPRMDQITAAGLANLNESEREKAMQEAMRLAMQDVAVIPLHTQKSVWGLRRGLTYTARVDEMTLATEVRTAR
ncbi:ABC transporter substrate-binding protein [Pseudoroseomonas cervicalis]|uniref:ABC transporter substrate-binding protein n=1 Tax=Teichococcus cervicalis TaxID=204525 RepID=UPI002786E705|nr:ABC transporter substrate-binding protein [Pseudoroseomonas cervicalis]MDQ1080286.1 peptide/nickel transport system substrate-binding protein [Pseudoroseomonas cervicalis]